jgi:hypothetical protein
MSGDFIKKGDFLMKEIRELFDRVAMIAGSCLDNEDPHGAMMLLDVSYYLDRSWQDLTETPTRTAESESIREWVFLTEALSALKVVRDMAAAMPTDRGPLSRMLLLDQLMDDMSRFRGRLRDQLITTERAVLAA